MVNVDSPGNPKFVDRSFTHSILISDSPRRSLDIMVDANERLPTEQLDVLFKIVCFIVGPMLNPEKFGSEVFDFDEALAAQGFVVSNPLAATVETNFHKTDEDLG